MSPLALLKALREKKMRKGMGAFEVIVYVLIVIVVFILVAYFVIPNFKSLSDSFFNILGSFK